MDQDAVEAGRGWIVTIDKGSADAVDVGTVLAVYRVVPLMPDPRIVERPLDQPNLYLQDRYVKVPDERIGLIFVFLFAFQEYLTATILTDVNARTVPVFIATQLGQTLPMLQQAGAAAVLFTIPAIAFAFIAQKYIVAGLSAGSVKG
jgi:hypothetical protein